MSLQNIKVLHPEKNWHCFSINNFCLDYLNILDFRMGNAFISTAICFCTSVPHWLQNNFIFGNSIAPWIMRKKLLYRHLPAIPIARLDEAIASIRGSSILGEARLTLKRHAQFSWNRGQLPYKVTEIETIYSIVHCLFTCRNYTIAQPFVVDKVCQVLWYFPPRNVKRKLHLAPLLQFYWMM